MNLQTRDQARDVAHVSSDDLQPLLAALQALKRGEAVRLPDADPGITGKIASAFNDVVALNTRWAEEVSRLSRVVGKEGKLKQRAMLGDGQRVLARVDRVGQLADRRPGPPDERDGARDRRRGARRPVQDHGARGRRPPARGRVPAHRQDHQHAWSTSSASFAAEVTRVAREVGTEGKLGGQAKVKGVAGTWKDLTDRVNSMAGNLTAQVRNIADVTTAVAQGDLSRRSPSTSRASFSSSRTPSTRWSTSCARSRRR